MKNMMTVNMRSTHTHTYTHTHTEEAVSEEKAAETETGTNAIEVPLSGIAGHVARTSELLNFNDVYVVMCVC